MPTIAVVNGVKVMIFPRDHLPPHLHCRFAEFEILLSIATGKILEGSMPPAKLKSLTAWLDAHRAEVSYIWSEIRRGRNPGGIEG
jgi:hypothetical protein